MSLSQLHPEAPAAATSPVRRGAIARSTVLAAMLLSWAVGHTQILLPAPPPPPNARAAAPRDFTGYWVALVTEDWRVRMMTPDKGDFQGIPLNAAGRTLLAAWDPAKDEAAGEQCKSYGAPAIMRVPTRLHITWEGDDVLRVDTDAGEQTRRFHFKGAAPAGETPSLQGYSAASWEGSRPRGQLGVTATLGSRANSEGYLKVLTTDLKPGYLRKNGVPYGARAQVEEYFETFTEPNGDSYLIVTGIVTDPDYLDGSFLTSSHFRKLPGPTGWRPSACEAR